MIKKDQLVLYTPLCIALILHLIVVLCLFFIQEHTSSSTGTFSEQAPVIFEERGEAGTPIGTLEGTEIAKEFSAQPVAEPTLEETAEIEETQEGALATEQVPETTEQALPVLQEPAAMPQALPAGKIQPDVVPQYAQPIAQAVTKPRKRAAWHVVNPEARARAAGLNMSKHIRSFTDQQYDAYGTPDGTGGSSDHGTGTGGGGNAAYRANMNALDLIKQSYMRKVVRAIVAQSNFMQIMVATPYPISKTVTWKIIINAQAKVTSIEKEEETHHSLDNAISKIIYATQLPPVPSKFKDGFVFYARFMLNHSGQMAPLILQAMD